ncbi:MAG: glycoside hydrolase family 2 protein [Ilumatobacter sp.]
MQLGDRWVAIEANDDVRRSGIGLDTDDSDWAEIDVPGHWQHSPEFAGSQGPLMYRHRFRSDAPADGRRRWITFDGIFYQGDAWLDGAYLGDPEGYFFPHSFDVTALARIGEEHVLAVEIACAPQSQRRTNVTGVLQSWDGLSPNWNPGGLWRTVRMYDTGPVRIDRMRALCRDADARRAHVVLAASFDSDAPREAVVVTRRDGTIVDEQQTTLATGINDLEWSVDIRRPELWWPRELGDQHLTTFAVEVVVDGERSDERQRRLGLRQIDWNDWVFSVNGERLFLRGTNLTPITEALGDTTDALIERDLAHVIDLGLNAVRVHGHISRRCLYDRADELGLLILQDFPLERAQARSVRNRAVEQASVAVDQLGHHPSIALWSAHNEPDDTSMSAPTDWRGRLRDIASQQLPSWNTSVLDRWVKREFERSDPSRPTIAQSGAPPRLSQRKGTDRHLWFGWATGDADDLARHARRLPSSVRFVSEFGSDSVPSDAPFIDEQLADGHRWPDLDWDRISDEAGYARELMEALFDPADFESFDSWRDTTQLYQSHVLKVQIETLRRMKYRPSGGFCFSRLADARPVVSASILDHRRTPKDAYEAVRHACAPVIVVADVPPDWVNPGDPLRLDVHLVNDRRTPLGDARVTATATWAGGRSEWRFGGPVDADDVVKVGVVSLAVPDTLGELAIEFVATDGDEAIAGNRYTTAVVMPTEPG